MQKTERITPDEVLGMIERMDVRLPSMSNENAAELIAGFAQGDLRLRDIHGLTDEQMEASYALATMAFQSGAYARAERLFRFLATMDPEDKRYLIGLAAARFNLKRYAEARDIYGAAFAMDPWDPGLMIRLAECHFHMRDFATADEALEVAIELAGDDPKRAKDRARAEALRRTLAARRSAS